MTAEKHAECRAWAFQALDQLEAFLDDPDFAGEVQEERDAVSRIRKELRESKYRVVFLGAFNVGKSTLINALLGDEYLPTILEECTVKTTYVVRAQEMQTVLHLCEPASEEEVEALSRLMDSCGSGARVVQEQDYPHITIAHMGTTAKEVLKTLTALVTISSEEDFPELKTLRAKLEEVAVHLPTNWLEEDVMFVDSPGVHSISETSERIAQEILPQCHLVVCMVESHSAGNRQNRSFIESIVRHRHRKVFFVINKSDQLNPEEIDLNARKGPAKDLVRSLKGIVDRPEFFFLSSLYALTAAQLAQDRITLEDLDNNNKIKIPFGIQRTLLSGDNPTHDVADYLIAQSNVPAFKRRLLDYLYRENREGAVVESVCKFVDARAWQYARPLETKLALARDNPRLDEIRILRQRIEAELENGREQERRAIALFRKMSIGGETDKESFPGYDAFVEQRVTHAAIEQAVLGPLARWIGHDEKVNDARKANFGPLLTEMECAVNGFLRRVQEDINDDIEFIEQRLVQELGEAAASMEPSPRVTTEMIPGDAGPLRISLGSSYAMFGSSGAAIAALTGAIVGGVLTHWTGPIAAMGAVIGALVGAGGGLLLRAATKTRLLQEKLTWAVREMVTTVVFESTADGGPSLKERLLDAMAERRKAFEESIRRTFDKALAGLCGELDALQVEEDRLRREQEETIARLEPKVERLAQLGRTAHEIAEATAPQESALP